MNRNSELVNARSTSTEKTFDLESVDGGWVTIRRLKHGESTERLDEILSFRPGVSADTTVRVLSNWKARIFDFSHCIVDHNLGDESGGTKFDFSKEADVYELAEDIGDEIQGIINGHHGRLAIEMSEDDDIPESDPNS